MMPGCTLAAYELAPGLPTLYCAGHRAPMLVASRKERMRRE